MYIYGQESAKVDKKLYNIMFIFLSIICVSIGIWLIHCPYLILSVLSFCPTNLHYTALIFLLLHFGSWKWRPGFSFSVIFSPSFIFAGESQVCLLSTTPKRKLRRWPGLCISLWAVQWTSARQKPRNGRLANQKRQQIQTSFWPFRTNWKALPSTSEVKWPCALNSNPKERWKWLHESEWKSTEFWVYM